jgi:3-hydroxyisobutyrate dehydrogenase-like beta-hydroxyacid dehydrogenase
MKQKTSITLSSDVLRDLAERAGSGASRSAYIERVLRRHFRRQRRRAEQAKDIERINAAAQRLNAEAEDVMEYQAPWSEEEPTGERHPDAPG